MPIEFCASCAHTKHEHDKKGACLHKDCPCTGFISRKKAEEQYAANVAKKLKADT